MKRLILLSGVALCSVAMGAEGAEGAEGKEGAAPQSVEARLQAADAAWIAGAPANARPMYRALLGELGGQYAPMRSMVVLRLARASLASGDKQGSLQALDVLNDMEYVPEHHVLEARELRALATTGRNPAYERTPIPPLPAKDVRIEVRHGAGDGDGDGGRTLQGAVAEARAAMASGRSAEIVIAPGVYVVDAPVVLGPADAGLVIRSIDARNPAVLRGGVVLRTWTPVSDPQVLELIPEQVRAKVLVCDLGSHGIAGMGELVLGGFASLRGNPSQQNARFASLPVPELFYKGEPQKMATWPNEGYAKLPVRQTPEQPDARYARWAKEPDLWLHGYWTHLWADAHEKVASVAADGTIELVPPTNRYGFGVRLGRAVNSLCEMDQAGEWHLDTRRNLVHFLPPEGFDPQQCILSAYPTVISATGCAGLQIRDLRIGYVRGDGIALTDCSNAVVAGVDLSNCSGSGILVTGGKEHLIHSLNIRSMGRGGIDFSAGDWRKLEPCNSTIENCRIERLSRIDRTYTPGVLLEGMGITIRHSSFADIPSSAIRIEACDARIELNSFAHCAYESDDQGAIDMWGNPLLRGNVIRWNDFDRIINAKGGKMGVAAVRPDDFVSGLMIAENIFRTGSDGGFASVNFNGGTDSYVEGNIIIDWHKAFGGWTRSDDWEKAITEHGYTKTVLASTPWQSEPWQRKYPKVRELFRGDDNHNYLADNRRFGPGAWGGVHRAIQLNNVAGDGDIRVSRLEEVWPLLVPWRPIPLDRIGPYRAAGAERPHP